RGCADQIHRQVAAERFSAENHRALRRREPESRIGVPTRQQPVKKISKGHHSSLNELNITPLLDLAFVLLVIFIITTPQLSNDLEMNLPSAKKAKAPATPPKIARIVVDIRGKV